MNPIIVTVIEHNVVSEQYLFTGEYSRIAAEQKFIKLWRAETGNPNSLTDEDINDILNDGYLEVLSGKSICITHPQVALEE